MYPYVGGDPVNARDPSGLMGCDTDYGCMYDPGFTINPLSSCSAFSPCTSLTGFSLQGFLQDILRSWGSFSSGFRTPEAGRGCTRNAATKAGLVADAADFAKCLN